jgi:pSer/pThr/pTyr-binding forkhead associated (FHA) protein
MTLPVWTEDFAPPYRQGMPATAPPAPDRPMHPPVGAARLALPRGERTLFWIGRAPDSDIVIDHPTVSRHHAELRREDCGWSLTDLWSTNGTRVNGWRITSRCSVRQGDQVSFGDASFQLVD